MCNDDDMVVDDSEGLENLARVPRERAQPPGVVVLLAMDPVMWLNMVNLKSLYLRNRINENFIF